MALQRRREEMARQVAASEQRAQEAEEAEARAAGEIRALALERDSLSDALSRVSSGEPAPTAAAASGAAAALQARLEASQQEAEGHRARALALQRALEEEREMRSRLEADLAALRAAGAASPPLQDSNGNPFSRQGAKGPCSGIRDLAEPSDPLP